MIKMTPCSRSATLLILATLIWAILPGNTPAASSGNAFVDDKTAGGNVLNVMGVLNVGGETAAGAGQIMAIFDICDAVEKANHGEYNDAMAILLKTGITTIFNTTIGPLVTSLDVGKLLRDATVNEVFEPRIQKHYEKYRDLRIADLEAELNDKMVEYTTYDFRRWAEDSRGETVENKGQDTVQDYIKNDLLADGKRNTYLYNIAQMRIQDAKHEKASFAAKWWPRFWTSEKPCSVEDAKNHWINTWNGRVTTEGLQITVDRRKQFAKFWSESSEILIVVDVDNPIEGLTYGIECVELNWREKGAVSQGADGNYVLFVKEIDMKEFSKLCNKYGRNDGLTIQLKAPGRSGKTVASKRILFSELMSAQYANKKKTKNVGMWTVFRVPIRFDWNPELLEQLDLKLNGNAKVDYIGIRIRNTTIALRPKPKSGALRAGELPLEKHFKGGKIDLISVLEASGMPAAEVLECLYGSQDDLFFNFNISCTFQIPDPERDPQRDPPDKMKTYAWQRDLVLPEPDTKLDFSFTPQKRPIIEKSEERYARAKALAKAYATVPGTQPKDEFIYQQKLPMNSSDGGVFMETRNRRVAREFDEPVAKFGKTVEELSTKLGEIFSDYVYPSKEELRTVDHGALSLQLPIPAYKPILASDIDKFTKKIDEGRQKLDANIKDVESLLATDAADLETTAKQLVNLNLSTRKFMSAISTLHDLQQSQKKAMLELDEYEAVAKGMIEEYDILLKKLERPAAAAAFYLPRIEALRKSRLTLREKQEALIKEDVRSEQHVQQIVSLLQTFNGWATAPDARHQRAHCTSLNNLYEFATTGTVPRGVVPRRELSEMISGIDKALAKVVIPEIQTTEEASKIEKQLSKYKAAVMASGTGSFSPLAALYVNDISSSDIKASLAKPNGRLSEATRVINNRRLALQQKWGEADKRPPPPADRRAIPMCRFWSMWAQGAMDGFLTLTEPETMSKGDGKAKEWLAGYNALRSKAGNINATGHLQETLAFIKDAELLNQKRADLYGSPWQDRYEAEWANDMRQPTISTVFVKSLAKAWVGAMDIFDKKMQQDIKTFTSLPADKQKAERERLQVLANSRFWDALKLQPLMESDIGRGFHIACYTVNVMGNRQANDFDIALDRWSELQAIWTAALEGKPAKTTNTNQPRSNQAIDKEKPSASETTKEAHQRYIAAYNKMTSLMAEGKGDTPAGQTAYQDYVKQKKIYEATNNK